MKISIILNNPNFTDEIINGFRSLGEVDIINAKKISEDEAIKKMPETEILVCGTSAFSRIGEKLINGLEKLKFISILGVGYDWIDIEAAKKRNVLMSFAKGSNSEAVAEHTWGMILDLGKRISEFDRDLRSRQEIDVFKYQGIEMYGKTIGIIGLGEIGKRVARIARGFDMKIIGINKSKKQVEGVELVGMDKLLTDSDVIAICIPLTTETENIIDDIEIQKMRKGVIVVNCAREALVNKNAIIKGIDNGIVSGYGIETDIFEPISRDDDYFKNPKILINPHNAWNTKESLKNTYDVTINNIRSFLDGKPINTIFLIK